MKKNILTSMKPVMAGILLSIAATLATPAMAVCFSTTPTATPFITSNFGMRFHPVRKIRVLHGGTDFRAAVGTPLYAVHGGTVRVSAFNKGGGNMIELMGSDGIVTKYLHASKLIALKGATVAVGDKIAESGNTGEWSAGPHLHFITLVNGSEAVDPRQFFCGVTFPQKASAGPDAYQPGDPVQPVATVNAGTPPTAPVGSPPGTPPPAQIPAGITGLVAPPMQSFPSMDDMSVRDFLATETHKRFLNPQWYLELIDPAAALKADPKNAGKTYDTSNMDPTIYMLRELNVIMALDNLMATERYTNKENIEARMAAFLSLDAKNYSEKVMSLIRSQSTGAR